MPKPSDESTTDQLTRCHKSRLRAGPLALLCCLVLLGGCPRTPSPGGPAGAADKRTHIINFAVGQSDAMLVVHRGRSLLYDAGATVSKVGRQNFRDIARRLEELVGHKTLDYFVVSHYHQDHIGLHEGISVDTLVDRGFFIIGEKGNTQKNYEKAVRVWLREGKVRRRLRVKKDDLIDMGPGLKVEVIASNGNGRLLAAYRRMPGFFKEFPPSENDYSVVLKFTKGRFELVTGGDLSGYDVSRRFGPNGISYNDIETDIAEAIGDIEVYRVNHHGSKNSSNPCFIKVLNPEVSIFSTGMNSYGHPDPRVYNALKKMGQVYITSGADEDFYEQMKDDILEGDIDIVVSPSGKTYTVNGKKYKAKSDKLERARPGYQASCPPAVPTEMAYRLEEMDGDVHLD